MKKNVLALSIAAMFGGFAGVKRAEVIGEIGDGCTVDDLDAPQPGHMLVVPYYTAQNGNLTALHGAEPQGKPVKIRFRGTGHADDVLDFQTFLSPGDTWGVKVSPEDTAFRDRLNQALITHQANCKLSSYLYGPHTAGRLAGTTYFLDLEAKCLP